MSKELILEASLNICKEIWILLWKWGIWFLVLIFSIFARLFYEVVKEGKIRVFHLLAIGGLGGSVGIIALLICASYHLTAIGILLLIVSVFGAYKIVDYIVNIDLGAIIWSSMEDFLKKFKKQNKK